MGSVEAAPSERRTQNAEHRIETNCPPLQSQRRRRVIASQQTSEAISALWRKKTRILPRRTQRTQRKTGILGNSRAVTPLDKLGTGRGPRRRRSGRPHALQSKAKAGIKPSSFRTSRPRRDEPESSCACHCELPQSEAISAFALFPPSTFHIPPSFLFSLAPRLST